MLSRPVFFFCVSVRIEGKHKFHLTLPIPLAMLSIFADIAEDAGYLWHLFGGKRKIVLPPENDETHRQKYNPKDFAARWLSSPDSETLIGISRLLRNLLRQVVFHFGALDLVDVDVQSEEERIRVRCFFR